MSAHFQTYPWNNCSTRTFLAILAIRCLTISCVTPRSQNNPHTNFLMLNHRLMPFFQNITDKHPGQNLRVILSSLFISRLSLPFNLPKISSLSISSKISTCGSITLIICLSLNYISLNLSHCNHSISSYRFSFHCSRNQAFLVTFQNLSHPSAYHTITFFFFNIYTPHNQITDSNLVPSAKTMLKIITIRKNQTLHYMKKGTILCYMKTTPSKR